MSTRGNEGGSREADSIRRETPETPRPAWILLAAAACWRSRRASLLLSWRALCCALVLIPFTLLTMSRSGAIATQRNYCS